MFILTNTRTRAVYHPHTSCLSSMHTLFNTHARYISHTYTLFITKTHAIYHPHALFITNTHNVYHPNTHTHDVYHPHIHTVYHPHKLSIYFSLFLSLLCLSLLHFNFKKLTKFKKLTINRNRSVFPKNKLVRILISKPPLHGLPQHLL